VSYSCLSFPVQRDSAIPAGQLVDHRRGDRPAACSSVHPDRCRVAPSETGLTWFPETGDGTPEEYQSEATYIGYSGPFHIFLGFFDLLRNVAQGCLPKHAMSAPHPGSPLKDMNRPSGIGGAPDLRVSPGVMVPASLLADAHLPISGKKNTERVGVDPPWSGPADYVDSWSRL